jgi:NAD(P)-dependent dehydrogenase (short-subunit alcohol dehydrogenase family)
MRARGGGSMTMMGSVHAFVERPKLVAYGVSKNALQGLVRELAALLKNDRVRVNLITVGWVLTETEKQIRMKEDGGLDRAHRYAAQSPWGLNTEAEMASGCVYLASDEALRVTGTNLNISGGLTLTL